MACLDEAGRGPLAGPVIACAVCLDRGLVRLKPGLGQIKDSKKLSAKKREEFYNILAKHPGIEWGIGR
ncbi:MAG: ribonuclease HII, partial [Pseudomonadota bacterium]